MDCDIFISVHNVTNYAIKVGYHANNCDWFMSCREEIDTIGSSPTL